MRFSLPKEILYVSRFVKNKVNVLFGHNLNTNYWSRDLRAGEGGGGVECIS
jgi:hypothetical protein